MVKRKETDPRGKAPKGRPPADKVLDIEDISDLLKGDFGKKPGGRVLEVGSGDRPPGKKGGPFGGSASD